jgi:hypothetical protein
MFSSNSFFTEITVGGCNLAGIGARGSPRNLPQFFPSEIDLGGCKVFRESLSLRAELSSVVCALKTTWVVAWLAGTSMYDELENIPQTFSL